MYSLDMCDRVIEIGRDGGSVCEMAVGLGITRDTLYRWMEVHSEFSDSVKHARELSQAWWEKTGRDALHADKFQSVVWKKIVEARFPNDYRDNTRVEVAPPTEGMTEEDRIQRINAILAKAAKRAD